MCSPVPWNEMTREETDAFLAACLKKQKAMLMSEHYDEDSFDEAMRVQSGSKVPDSLESWCRGNAPEVKG